MRALFACFIGGMARRVGATERGIACLPSSPAFLVGAFVPRPWHHLYRHDTARCPTCLSDLSRDGEI